MTMRDDALEKQMRREGAFAPWRRISSKEYSQ
jgi:hypothetical protein